MHRVCVNGHQNNHKTSKIIPRPQVYKFLDPPLIVALCTERLAAMSVGQARIHSSSRYVCKYAGYQLPEIIYQISTVQPPAKINQCFPRPRAPHAQLVHNFTYTVLLSGTRDK